MYEHAKERWLQGSALLSSNFFSEGGSLSLNLELSISARLVGQPVSTPLHTAPLPCTNSGLQICMVRPKFVSGDWGFKLGSTCRHTEHLPHAASTHSHWVVDVVPVHAALRF